MARIWLVIGDKLGDNAQVAMLAEKLGLPTERRELRFKEQWVLGKPRFSASLHHLDPGRSAPLEAPWPDLIITIGRRPAMAALWVKRQSGGRSRLVLIGRPKRHFDEFDLVIGTGQYGLPDRPNVLRLPLPLMQSDVTAVNEAAAAWQPRLAALPRPLTAVLIGGATKPFRFGAAEARHLIEQVMEATGGAGTLYVSTSRRTGREVNEALEEVLPPGARLFRWSGDAREEDNPYLALLGSADRFVVTGDSVSMMVEVARLGRPLAIAALPYAGGAVTRAAMALQQRLLSGTLRGGLLQSLRERLFELGLFGYSRDFAGFHRLLHRRGLATFIEEGFRHPSGVPEDSAVRAAQAVRSLLPEENQASPKR